MYKVILADDEPIIVAGLVKRIDWPSLGFNIIGKCFDGQQVINKVRSTQPDLLVIDIRMPKYNGLEVIKTINKNYKTKVIIISGYSDFEYARSALQLGAIDYLLKPITNEALYNAVVKARNLLDNQKASKNHSFIEYSTLRLLLRNDPIMAKSILLNSLGIQGRYQKYVCIAAYQKLEQINEKGKNSKNFDFSLIKFNKNITVLLINYSTLENSIETLAEETLGYDGYLGISRPFQDITQLIDYVHESCEILSSLFFTVSTEQLCYCNISDTKEHINLFLKNLDSALENNDYIKLKNILADVPRLFQDKSISSFERFFNTLIFKANQIIVNNKLKVDFEITYLNQDEIVEKFTNIHNATNYLKDLFNHVLSCIPPADNSAVVSSDMIIEIKEYIEDNFYKPLSLKEVSEKFHIDASYLSKRFRNEVGETFIKYITKVRMENACYMLKNTFLSCREISELCGYDDYSYFKKVFRRLFGITPTEYRG